MNNKYILIAVLALVPVAIKGMTGGNDYSHRSSDAARAGLVCADDLSYSAALNQLNQGRTRQDWANARSLAEAQKHRDIRGMFDAKDCTEWNPFTPTPGEPSFLSNFGNQLRTVAGFAIAGLIVTTLVKKYLTPQSERDRENAEATTKEQSILKNLESEIQRLIIAIPQREQELRTITNPNDIEWLNTVIRDAKELLQKRLAMHAALTQKFNEDQEQRYKEQLRRVGAAQKSAPAA